MSNDCITHLMGLMVAIMLSTAAVNGTTYTVTNTADTSNGSLRTSLPNLTDQMGVFINGLSQPGSSVGSNAPSTSTLMIHLNGSQAGACHGIYILSSFNKIQGLVVDSFQQDGIRMEGTALPVTHNNTVLLFSGNQSCWDS